MIILVTTKVHESSVSDLRDVDVICRSLSSDRSISVQSTSPSTVRLISRSSSDPTRSRCDMNTSKFAANFVLDFRVALVTFISQSMPNLIELNLTVLGHCEEFSLRTMKRIAAMKQLRQLTLPNYHLCASCLYGSLLAWNSYPYLPFRPIDLAVSSLATSGLLGLLRQLSVVGITDKSLDTLSQCAKRFVSLL